MCCYLYFRLFSFFVSCTISVACWNHEPSKRPTFEEVRGMIEKLSITEILNMPGFWDVFISHTQRNAEAKSIADRLCASLGEHRITVWLDVNMMKKSVAAMQEGVTKSTMVIAIITGACKNNDRPSDKEEDNAYFNRPFCVKELQWAKEAGITIQPVIRMEDKTEIGTFLSQAPDDLKDIGNIDFIDLNRSDKEYWDVGVNKIVRALTTAKQEKDKVVQ